jgi:uncharacterized membrane protein (UPF0136 family)
MPFSRKNREVFPYIVLLKRKSQFTEAIVSLIAGFFFLLLLFRKLFSAPEISLLEWAIAVPFVGLFAWAVFRVVRRRRPELAFMVILAIGALVLLEFPSSLFYVLLAITGYLSSKPEEIGFSEREIVFSRMFPRRIPWTALNNALIKDGILTLDYKNNKIFQAETDDDNEDDDYDVSEEEFNAFCAKCLRSN